MTTYLLEKTRVCAQSPGERNYHIFYDLLTAGRSQEDLCLYSASTEYWYLNQSRNEAYAGEQGMYEQVQKSMEVCRPPRRCGTAAGGSRATNQMEKA